MNETKTYRPFIPSWLDDLGLSTTQFRIFCHLSRRAGRDGKCHPAAASIMNTCRVSENTLWRALKELEKAELIFRDKHFRNSNAYQIATSPPDRITAKETAIQTEVEDGESKANHRKTNGASHRKRDGDQSPQKRRCKGNPIEGNPMKASRGSNSAPNGSAFIASQQAPFPDLGATEDNALALWEQERRNPDTALGMFPPEEVQEWARTWHTEAVATGGHYKGSKIRNPEAALHAYLKSCATRQSKRFRETGWKSTNPEDDHREP